MFGLFGSISKVTKFDKISNELLHKHLAGIVDDFEGEMAILVESQELLLQIMNAQIYAIASDGCNGKLRKTLLSSFARMSLENESNLLSFFEHSAMMKSSFGATEENRNRMYYHVGKWTVEEISHRQVNHLGNFSDEFITKIGEVIYNTAIMAAVNSKLIKV